MGSQEGIGQDNTEFSRFEKTMGINKVVDDFIHNELLPVIQSLKAHKELASNGNFHISPKVLGDILNRLTNLRNSLLQLTEEK
jgi:hypothetical protein